jgi:hypothetical protein
MDEREIPRRPPPCHTWPPAKEGRRLRELWESGDMEAAYEERERLIEAGKRSGDIEFREWASAIERLERLSADAESESVRLSAARALIGFALGHPKTADDASAPRPGRDPSRPPHLRSTDRPQLPCRGRTCSRERLSPLLRTMRPRLTPQRSARQRHGAHGHSCPSVVRVVTAEVVEVEPLRPGRPPSRVL